MRLGNGTTGSSGYGQHAASVHTASRRRKSAVEAMGGGMGMAGLASPAHSAFLRPPAAMSARGRRFSDSLNLMAAAAAQQSRSKSRKGGEYRTNDKNPKTRLRKFGEL